jgi:hypothetical protein
MSKGISVIVCRAESGDGREVPVYRALRALRCSSCGATIGEGALFTRRALPDGRLRVAAECRECAPFVARGKDGKGQRRSPLLESLLGPEPAGETVLEHRPVDQRAEPVRKRLGPALRFRAGRRGPDR